MLTPYTDRQSKLIINNVLVLASGEHNYEYYQSKARIYDIIVQGLLKKGY